MAREIRTSILVGVFYFVSTHAFGQANVQVVLLGDNAGLEKWYDSRTNTYYTLVLEPQYQKQIDMVREELKRQELDGKAVSAGVAIAFLDTGIMHRHPAFAKLKIVDADFTGDGAEDTIGHGTGVLLAYLAGAIYPERDVIYNVKVIGKNASETVSNINRALRWIAKQDIRLVNLSLGVPKTQDDSVCRTAEEVYRDNDILISAAAGNDPDVVMCPAAAAGVISVGQVDMVPPIDVRTFQPPPIRAPWRER